MLTPAYKQNGEFVRIRFSWRTSVTASSAGAAMITSQNGNTDEVGWRRAKDNIRSIKGDLNVEIGEQ
jgi:hypothetical protein